MSEQSGLNTSPPRSRLPLILGVGLLLVAIVIATVVITSQVTGGKEDLPTTTTAPPTTTAPASPGESPTAGSNAAGADGCLGGVNPSKAVLKAQAEAPLDAKGAAGFAATVMRWYSQYPMDENYSQTAQRIMAEDAGPDMTNRTPPEGAPGDSGWLTTADGRYRVTQISPETATVEMTLPGFVESPELEDTGRITSTARWRLKAVDGRWRVVDVDGLEREADQKVIADEGFAFKGAC